MHFRQSTNDFPLQVALGDKSPFFGLHRYKTGLRFVPSDDEGFTVRGDKQRLFYKGRRRSHRFTILGDNAFEYDCILNKEPETNVLTLLLDGAENFDFFRQPDFVNDPFLKGSYAVYKKETMVGDGTGKMCHIHRPEIIDARGRRCWGDLEVIGDELHITIPEKWLSGAKYPVIVDPTVGTSTVGSQYKHFWEEGEPEEQLYFEISIPVNCFLVPETINGNCTAYVYANYDFYGDEGGRPVLYSDSSNRPLTRKSANEGFIDLRVTGGKTAGWRTGTFISNGSIASGSNIWFGVFCEYTWYPRFDYGAKNYADSWEDYDSIPNTYPIYSYNNFENFKLSMYFTYTSAQNHVRVLTQGVKLNDNLKHISTYKRLSTQKVYSTSVLSGIIIFFRQCLMNVSNNTSLLRFPTFIRSADNNTVVSSGISNNRELSRIFNDMTIITSELKKSRNIFKNLFDGFTGYENVLFPVLFVRSVFEIMRITELLRQWRYYIRGLFVEAGNRAETVRQCEYYRSEYEIIKPKTFVFRGLVFFVKILTISLVRDFILRRFLIAREDLTLKSCIVREIFLDSKIN